MGEQGNADMDWASIWENAIDYCLAPVTAGLVVGYLFIGPFEAYLRSLFN